jgi:hypothetical protein
MHLYGSTPTTAFDALKLQTVRRLLVDGYEHPEHGPQKPLARFVVNQRVGRIRRMVRWAAGQKLPPASVYTELATVDVFGEATVSGRLVIGVASLPLGSPVELEVILEVKP